VPLKSKDHILTFEEIVRMARLFAELGVNKIRLTGGEPLVRKGIEILAAELSAIPGIDELAITTNGLLLESRLHDLRSAGVTQLNVSLDTLRPERFVDITRRIGLPKVVGAIDAALDAGYSPVKVNCVVLKGLNDDELVEFVEFSRDRDVDIRFIEFMPFQGNEWSSGKFVSYREMIEAIEPRYELQPVDLDPHAISKTYRVPGFTGSVGFISSMSDDFCAGCNRLRITADGNLKVCLFGKSEVSLRELMRQGDSDDAIEHVIRAAVLRKKASHAGMEAIASSPGRPMILIGG
jgi:cyclic pyranopterin phosphate synthase